MTFGVMEGFKKFYKIYAHNVDFTLQNGQRKTVDNGMVRMHFLCGKSFFQT